MQNKKKALNFIYFLVCVGSKPTMASALRSLELPTRSLHGFQFGLASVWDPYNGISSQSVIQATCSLCLTKPTVYFGVTENEVFSALKCAVKNLQFSLQTEKSIKSSKAMSVAIQAVLPYDAQLSLDVTRGEGLAFSVRAGASFSCYAALRLAFWVSKGSEFGVRLFLAPKTLSNSAQSIVIKTTQIRFHLDSAAQSEAGSNFSQEEHQEITLKFPLDSAAQSEAGSHFSQESHQESLIKQQEDVKPLLLSDQENKSTSVPCRFKENSDAIALSHAAGFYVNKLKNYGAELINDLQDLRHSREIALAENLEFTTNDLDDSCQKDLKIFHAKQDRITRLCVENYRDFAENFIRYNDQEEEYKAYFNRLLISINRKTYGLYWKAKELSNRQRLFTFATAVCSSLNEFDLEHCAPSIQVPNLKRELEVTSWMIDLRMQQFRSALEDGRVSMPFQNLFASHEQERLSFILQEDFKNLDEILKKITSFYKLGCRVT